MAETKYVLASRSPRRLELLRSIGIECEVRPADIDETPLESEDPIQYALRLAREKAQRAARGAAANEIVIGADTTVDLDGQIIGQPVDAEDAAAILHRLSGRSHFVHTGVAIIYAKTGIPYDTVVSSEVTFRELSENDVRTYVASGEWEGKAGGYAIQGEGRGLVAELLGSLNAVIGLPVEYLETLLVPYED